MTNEFWHTGWDPEQILRACQHNITELIKAHNAQQEIIEHLLAQNAKLNELIKLARIEINQLRTEVNAQTNT